MSQQIIYISGYLLQTESEQVVTGTFFFFFKVMYQIDLVDVHRGFYPERNE